jgi:hypothetical protein
MLLAFEAGASYLTLEAVAVIVAMIGAAAFAARYFNRRKIVGFGSTRILFVHSRVFGVQPLARQYCRTKIVHRDDLARHSAATMTREGLRSGN